MRPLRDENDDDTEHASLLVLASRAAWRDLFAFLNTPDDSESSVFGSDIEPHSDDGSESGPTPEVFDRSDIAYSDDLGSEIRPLFARLDSLSDPEIARVFDLLRFLPEATLLGSEIAPISDVPVVSSTVSVLYIDVGSLTGFM